MLENRNKGRYAKVVTLLAGTLSKLFIFVAILGSAIGYAHRVPAAEIIAFDASPAIGGPKISDLREMGGLDDDVNLAIIRIEGRIEKGDAEKFEAKVAEANDKNVLVVGVALISRGGELEEGLKLGRLFRRYSLRTRAPSLNAESGQCERPDKGLYGVSMFADLILCECSSSCALAALGGLRRQGEVGLHHHYLKGRKGKEFSFNEFSAVLEVGREEILRYLNEMNTPAWFEEKLFSTNSTRIEKIDLGHTGLEFDPIFYEFIVSKCGVEPPDAARSLSATWRKQFELGLMDDGEEYAHRLLRYTIDRFDNCKASSLVGTLMETQSLTSEYDSFDEALKWFADQSPDRFFQNE